MTTFMKAAYALVQKRKQQRRENIRRILKEMKAEMVKGAIMAAKARKWTRKRKAKEG